MHTWQKRTEMERQKATQFPLLPTEDPATWNSILVGPTETPYEDAQFLVEFRTPSGYSFQVPYLQLKTPIYHANIHESGMPYCSLVMDGWIASRSLQFIVLYLENLLLHPDPVYGCNMEAAELLRKDRGSYETAAQAYLSKILTAEQTTAIENAKTLQTSD